MKFSTKKLCRAGIIAALYVALTFVVFPIASTPIQFRPSEALTLLPIFYPEAIPALFVGCIISNWVTGCTIADIFLGSLITLVAAICTYFIGKIIKNDVLRIILGGLFPVVLNALFLPLIWMIYAGNEIVYFVEVPYLLASQSLAIYVLGTLLYFAMKKLIVRFPTIFTDTTAKKVESDETVTTVE